MPGVAVVTWSDGIGCGTTVPPVAAAGYAVTLYANGFPVQNGVTFGGITISGCVGVGGIAFDPAGNLYASDYVTGDVYRIPPGGAIVSDANRITATPIGTSVGAMTFGGDGNLYAVRLATSGDFSTGAVLRINTINGATTSVSSNLPCPFNIATDPLERRSFRDRRLHGRRLRRRIDLARRQSRRQPIDVGLCAKLGLAERRTLVRRRRHAVRRAFVSAVPGHDRHRQRHE